MMKKGSADRALCLIIGNNLKKLRKDTGLTQQQLADQTGIVRQSIDRFEHGLRMPSAGQLLQLAQAFGATTDALMK